MNHRATPSSRKAAQYQEKHTSCFKDSHQQIQEKACNVRYNANYPHPLGTKEQTILNELEKTDRPLTPKEIASNTGIKDSTVRVYLQRLKTKGYAHQRFRGYYQATKNVVTLGGVGVRGGAVVTRCHKLVLLVKNSSGLVGRRVLVENEAFKVVVAGKGGGRATVFVDCKGSYSFDYAAFCLLVELIMARLGIDDINAVEVRSVEFNNDFKGVLLEGVKAVTLSDFKGAFERIYQKEKGRLRSEANVQQQMSVEAAYTLLKGGITPFNTYQSSFQQIQEVSRLVEAVKFGNRTNARIAAYLQAIVGKLNSLLDRTHPNVGEVDGVEERRG